MKPGCNLCGASLVEEDYALIYSGCARPREEWLKDQAEQLAIAHQMGYTEGEAMHVTHNVAYCISPEAVAEGKREAYIQGAKDFAEEVYVRARRIAGKKNTDYREFGAAFLELEYERARGKWPKEE